MLPKYFILLAIISFIISIAADPRYDYCTNYINQFRDCGYIYGKLATINGTKQVLITDPFDAFIANSPKYATIIAEYERRLRAVSAANSIIFAPIIICFAAILAI